MTRQRISSVDLARAVVKMEMKPGKWIQIPTKSEDQARVISRQRMGHIPSMPKNLFEAKVVDGVAYGRLRADR